MLELQSLENERLIQTMGRLVSLEDTVSSKVRNVSNEAANSTNGVANIMAHSVHMEDKMTGTQDFDDIEGETVIEVSKYITRRNLWWRAFNLHDVLTAEKMSNAVLVLFVARNRFRKRTRC